MAPIGGSADVNTTGPSPESLGLGSSAAVIAGARVLVDSEVAAAALLTAEWPTETSGSIDIDAGDGITPNGVVMGLVTSLLQTTGNCYM